MAKEGARERDAGVRGVGGGRGKGMRIRGVERGERSFGSCRIVQW